MKRQEYILITLMEELGELQQCIGKMLRFGVNDHHPSKSTTNLEDACRELSDVIAMVHLCRTAGINLKCDQLEINKKKIKFVKYFDYSVEKGIIQ